MPELYPKQHDDARPKDVTDAQKLWLRSLLANTRDAFLLTERVDQRGKTRAHATLLYSMFTFALTDNLAFIWTADPTSEHIRNIERDISLAQAAGEAATALVGLRLADTSSKEVTLEVIDAEAYRPTDPAIRQRAFDIYSYRRQQKGEAHRPLAAKGDYDEPLELYIAEARVLTTQGPVVLPEAVGGHHVREGHAPVDQEWLREFDTIEQHLVAEYGSQ